MNEFPSHPPMQKCCTFLYAGFHRVELLLFFVVAVKGVSNALYNGIWLSGNVEEFRDTFNIFLVGLEGSIKLSIIEISQPKRRKKPGGASGEVMKTFCFVDPKFK